MSDASIYKGGTPVKKYMWCEGDFPEYHPPFAMPNILGTPPYDSHACGAYGLAYFTLGMPIRPSLMRYQYNAMTAANLQVGDIIRCIVIPYDHYATYLNFKIIEDDPALAGATVTLTAQTVSLDADGNYVYSEISNVEDAVTAQGHQTPIPLDTASNTMVSLTLVANNYTAPLYSDPDDGVIILGLRIDSLPTDTTIKLQDALNGWYMSAKIEGFECPTNL